MAILVLTLFGLIGLGASAAAADGSTTTAPSSPATSATAAPQNLTASPASPTSISVDWTSTTGAETSPNGFIVAIRRTWPAPVEPIGTPKCAELWRPQYERPTSGTQYATECVIEGLEPGSNYEIQVVESFYFDNNSDPATTYSGTMVHGIANVDVDVEWKEIGSKVTATWNLPADTTGIYSHGATFYDDQDRAVWSCYRQVAQTGRCVFEDVIDGDYRIEAITYGGYGSTPATRNFTINPPVPNGTDLETNYRWWSTVEGQMHLNVAWNHVRIATSASYVASAGGATCSATAADLDTPERLSCDIVTDTDNLSFPLAVTISGGNVDYDHQMPAPPARPKNPSNVGADQISQTSAQISWDHDPSSNATTYSVWMSNHSSSCTVSAPFSGRISCQLDGLAPGTTYEANVYADSEIGRRSTRTVRNTFTTDAPPPPPPPPELPDTDDDQDEDIPVIDPPEDPPQDPCTRGGEHFKKRNRAVNKAIKTFQRNVETAIDNLEDRPKKLSKKLKQLKKKRDRKIDTARNAYAASCGT